MVFPKNQCRDDFLRICAEAGILAYRGNPPSWLYRAAADDEQGYVKRLAGYWILICRWVPELLRCAGPERRSSDQRSGKPVSEAVLAFVPHV